MFLWVINMGFLIIPVYRFSSPPSYCTGSYQDCCEPFSAEYCTVPAGLLAMAPVLCFYAIINRLATVRANHSDNAIGPSCCLSTWSSKFNAPEFCRDMSSALMKCCHLYCSLDSTQLHWRAQGACSHPYYILSRHPECSLSIPFIPQFLNWRDIRSN